MKKILLIILLLIAGCSKPPNEMMYRFETDISSFLINLADTTDERIEKVISNAQEKAYEAMINGFDFIDVFEYEVKKDGMNLSHYYYGYGTTNDKIINGLRIKTDDAMNRVVEILQYRLDKSGVAGYSIRREPQSRIVVELAGVQNVDRIETLLQYTGLLEFYLIQNPVITNELITKLDGVAVQMDETWDYLNSESYRYFSIYHVAKNPELTGKFIKKASPDFSSLDGSGPKKAMVSLKMNSEGSRIWSGVTGENRGQQIIVTLDNKVLMTTTIREKNYDGRIKIEGFADINEAKDVASVLRIGALPISILLVEARLIDDLAQIHSSSKIDSTPKFVKSSKKQPLGKAKENSLTIAELFGEDNESSTVAELFGEPLISRDGKFLTGLFSSFLKAGIGKILVSETHAYKLRKLLSNKDYQKILNNYNSQFLLSKRLEEFKPYYQYYCDECGSGISGQPYQCVMYVCVKSQKGQVSDALPTFDSCSCGVAYMRKQGFAYTCP